MLNTLDVVDVGVWELFWPAVLILASINLLLQAYRPPSVARDATGEINSFAIMAGIKRTSGASGFERADLGSIVGGGELDLRRATIRPGEEALADVFSLMGRYKILVPDNWRIDSRVFAFMGGVEDKVIPPTDALAPRLVVRGALIMADSISRTSAATEPGRECIPSLQTRSGLACMSSAGCRLACCWPQASDETADG